MDWEDDSYFKHDLKRYSEVEIIDHDETPTPRTIQRYKENIQSNNLTSIFDADYDYTYEEDGDSLEANGKGQHRKRNKENRGEEFLSNENVKYVISGRGRGGRNVIVRPGAPNKPSTDDDEIRQQLRKVFPVGFANEVTENAIKAHKVEKTLASNSHSKSSTPLAYSTPVSKCNSPTSSTTQSPVVPTATPTPLQAAESPSAPKKPLPIGLILKQCREAHKIKQQELRRKRDNDAAAIAVAATSTDLATDLATQAKIEELLEEDRRQLKWDKVPSRSSSSSSHEGYLSWRNRDYSPPRNFSWRNKERTLNISSTEDFPSLK